MRPTDGSDSARTLDAGRLELSFRPGAKPGRTLPETLAASNGVELHWHGPDGAGELRCGALTARWTEDASRIGEAHLEGGWQPKRVVVLEFADLERARGWWSSEIYEAPKKLRQSASITKMIFVEGV